MDWRHAISLETFGTERQRPDTTFAALVAWATQYNHVRAALVKNDPLMAALGRPNREQTATSRPTAATTLQALELTNGSTLADMLRRGAQNLLAERSLSKRELVEQIYDLALDRPPTAGETALATELLGQPIQPAGVEDLLWAMIMLPEFQLIY